MPSDLGLPKEENMESEEEDLSVNILLFEGIRNMKEIKDKVMKGELKAAVVNPKFIYHIDQLIFASHKSLYNAKNKQLKTKSLFTELLYNLFPTRSIREALKTFGVQDRGNTAIFVTFCGENGLSNGLASSVKGSLVPLDKIRELRNITAIRKLYKISERINTDETLLDCILTKMSVKELLL